MNLPADRVLPAWPQTLARSVWASRWWALASLTWGAVLIASVWMVPGADLARFATQTMIAQSVLMLFVILHGTLRTARDGQPMSKVWENVFVPIHIAMLTATVLPIAPSAFGPISPWQVLGLWLRLHGVH